MCRISTGLSLLAILCGSCMPGPGAATSKQFLERLGVAERSLAPPLLAADAPRPNWSLEERMRHYHVPAVSIAIIENGTIVSAKAYGVADAETGKNPDTRTLFQAGSISKPIATIGALRLVERGTLSLDRPVNDFLKSWKVPDNDLTDERPVTLREIMSHTAGLTVPGFSGYPAGQPMPTVVQVLNGTEPANSPPVVVDKTPGESFRYSGGGMTVMQLAMTDATGKDFATLMRQLVLEPGGARSSTFEQLLPDTARVNIARAHVGAESIPMKGMYHRFPEMAAAGLWSTPRELCRLALALVASRRGDKDALLTQETVNEMLSVQPGVGADSWGLGVQLTAASDGLVFGHGGANEGFRASWFAYADGQGGAAIMANADNARPLLNEILSAIAYAYGWSYGESGRRAVVSLSNKERERIAGEFVDNIDAPHVVVHVQDVDATLELSAEPYFPRSRLYPESSSKFFAESGAEMAFSEFKDGRANRLVVRIEGMEIGFTRRPD